MPYTVTYYAPDGHHHSATLFTTAATKAKAREYIRTRLGGKTFGKWTDAVGNECWHESREPGCGGYCIEREN